MQDLAPTLFDLGNASQSAPPDPLVRRTEAMQAAYDAADARWQEEYAAFILRYLSKHADGTGEEIRIAYEASGLPQTPNSKRASGKIFREMRKAGLIREVGKRRSRLYGNDLSTYARV